MRQQICEPNKKHRKSSHNQDAATGVKNPHYHVGKENAQTHTHQKNGASIHVSLEAFLMVRE